MDKIHRLSGLIVLFTLIGLFSPSPVQAWELRAQKLEKYLLKMNSPLAPQAAIFVREADKNQLDYRLLASISGVESTFGRNYIRGTHNAYGWGGGRIYFASWEEGIARISTDLKTKYASRGAKTVDQIAPIYCPPNSSKWAYNVKNFMKAIDAQEISDPAVSQLALTL